MFDDWQSALAIVGAIFIAYGVILWIGTVVWTSRDIHDRTRDGVLHWVGPALVVLFNVPGLILYLMLRPGETLAEAYERRLETEAIRRDLAATLHSCPSCARPVDDEFLLCPYCRTRLREPCASCARPLDLAWVVCPFCGAAGPQPVTAAAPAAAAPARAPKARAHAPPTAAPPPAAVPPPEASPPPAASTTPSSPPPAGSSQ